MTGTPARLPMPARAAPVRDRCHLHGAGPVSYGWDVQPIDRRLLESDGGEWDDVQRWKRLHADRHLSVGDLHWEQPHHLHGAGPVPRRWDLQPLYGSMYESDRCERNDVQRRKRLHERRCLPERHVYRHSGYLHGAGPVSRGGEL